MNGREDDYIKKIIDEKLYPSDKFPRSLFPDLVPVLTNLCKKKGVDTSRQLEKTVVKCVGLKSLLYEEPGTLTIIYSNLIRRYVNKKHSEKNEIEEIVQEIIMHLLNSKIKGIKKRFDFSDPSFPTFTSYFMVTVRNTYIDIVRRELKRKSLIENNMDIEMYRDSKKAMAINSLIIEEEINKLNVIMKLYHKSAPKLTLALKVKYRVTIDDSDIISCFPDCSKNDMDLLRGNANLFFKNKKSMERIASVVNKYEGKSNNPDSLRRWTSIKVEEIKRHMNNIHPESPYNNATISDLIILFYKWKERDGE